MQNNKMSTDARQKLGTVIFAMLYGVIVLAVLAISGHMNWAELRPATGTAAALYNASDNVRPDTSSDTLKS